MNKIIKTKCKVGYIIQTQQQIDEQIFNEKKEKINAQTESKIFESLGVKTKEQAIISQITKLSEAVAFLATKTDKRTLSEAEKTEIEKQLKDFANIKKIVDDGKKLKAKLNK